MLPPNFGSTCWFWKQQNVVWIPGKNYHSHYVYRSKTNRKSNLNLQMKCDIIHSHLTNEVQTLFRFSVFKLGFFLNHSSNQFFVILFLETTILDSNNTPSWMKLYIFHSVKEPVSSNDRIDNLLNMFGVSAWFKHCGLTFWGKN